MLSAKVTKAVCPDSEENSFMQQYLLFLTQRLKAPKIY